MATLEQQIFQKGSTTYYFSSQFFPRKMREDVFRLYSFVRVADDYVDSVPAQTKEFYDLRRRWDAAKNDPNFSTHRSIHDSIDQRVVKNIVHVTRKYEFDQAWVEAFLNSMQADVQGQTIRTIDDTLGYIYGSAEVIGLMMARIMGLPNEAQTTAKLQGRAMQFINFLRDIDEDNTLGRCYFPAEDLAKFNLPDLRKVTILMRPHNFCDFMRFELRRYSEWQVEANTGFSYIPRRLRVPLQTAVDMYDWTARQIAADPQIVFTRQIKPRKRRVLVRGLYNGLIILPEFSPSAKKPKNIAQ